MPPLFFLYILTCSEKTVQLSFSQSVLVESHDTPRSRHDPSLPLFLRRHGHAPRRGPPPAPPADVVGTHGSVEIQHVLVEFETALGDFRCRGRLDGAESDGFAEDGRPSGSRRRRRVARELFVREDERKQCVDQESEWEDERRWRGVWEFEDGSVVDSARARKGASHPPSSSYPPERRFADPRN